MVVLGMLVTAKMGIVPAIPGRAGRVAMALVWSAFCGVGAVLVSGTPSVHDEWLGGCVIGGAIGALGFVWAPVTRQLKREFDPLFRRAKRVAKALLGDWEDDVGFLGDGRGSRHRPEAPELDAEPERLETTRPGRT